MSSPVNRNGDAIVKRSHAILGGLEAAEEGPERMATLREPEFGSDIDVD